MTKPKTKVKICGLSRPEDIKIVNRHKPDYIGFVFAKSKRQVSPQKAHELRKKLSPEIIPVGVFVDEPAENIIKLIENGTVGMVQLHGNEDGEYMSKLSSLLGKFDVRIPIIKALKANTLNIADYINFVDNLLFDSPNPGSGIAFDWNMLTSNESCKSKPFFLAGGLNPDNVATAIKQVKPYAIDVSSGVEINGAKSEQLVKEFIQASRGDYDYF
ncbi:MAG: phosphoribosylanthranilate isomerase [Oscillospiraceae bacterium]|nr:phosphoribosylanthranilate isomerase [Oscillospiraceae bacterium]